MELVSEQNKIMEHVKALKEFAKAVGCTLRAEKQADGSTDLVLYDANKEPLVTEFDSHDMVDSLTAYKGGHPKFEQALEDYSLAVKE
jgi:hypothetical protein